ncbi:MAG: sugar phosphate isomerase/epimerase [Blastocatellia bacterium]|nr:sugar phosphate isomerase/epimerase [Blastocatellia bacterium]
MQQTGLFSTSALMLPSALQRNASNKFKLGLQLFTIREAMAKDLRGTFQRIAAMGYQEVETSGFNYGNNKYYWGLEPKDASRLLSDCGLTTSSGHYDLDKYFGKSQQDELKRYTDQCIAGATALKQSYIVWPIIAPQYRTMDEMKRLAATLNTTGEQIKQGGLQLAYHNYGWDFMEQGGVIPYDIILKETDPALVKMELDLYWFSFGSRMKPLDWFKKQPGRFVIWHIKDMNKQNRELHEVVGDGQIDFKPIFKDAQLSGVKHMFVEQGNNYVPDAMSCVQRSAEYMKRSLLNNL